MYEEKCRRVAAAETQVQRGRDKQAVRVLTGDGLHPATDPAFNVLRKMHPSADHEYPVLVKTWFPSEAEITVAVNSLIPSNASMDFAGWSFDIIRPVSGDPVAMGSLKRLFGVWINCGRVLAEKIMPLITIGALLGFNKQEQCKQDLVNPLLRPVNKPTIVWKVIGELGLRHAEAKAAMEGMLEHQFGLGAPAGMQRIALTIAAAFAQGKTILKVDGVNAFNSANRLSLLKAMIKNCPAIAPFFASGYCDHKPMVKGRWDVGSLPH
jgi:hypothetical protein